MSTFLKRNKNKSRLLAKAQEYVSLYFDDFAWIQMVDWKADALRQKDIFGLVERVGTNVGTEEEPIMDYSINGLDLLPEGENSNIQLALPYIEAIRSWKDGIMGDYLLIRKPAVLEGAQPNYDYTNHGTPPISFTNLFLVINADLRPTGWEFPEI